MICYLSRNYRGVDNAGNKAKTDIEQIMESHGFRNVGLKQTRYRNVVVAFCRTLFSVLKSILCLRKGDVLVLQYPLKKYYAFVCNMAHLRGCKVVTLIHDLGSFRRKKLTIPQEIARLDHSDCVIVHSERMRDWLLEHGIKAKLQILEIFDYLSDISGSGEGGTGAAPRARPPRLGRSAGSTEGDGGEVRADGGLCRHRPTEVGLPPERGQRGFLPGLPGSRHRTPQPCHPGACGERTGRSGSEAVPRKGGKPGTEGCAPAGGQPGKPHGVGRAGTKGAARQATNRRDRQKEASGKENQNVGQP